MKLPAWACVHGEDCRMAKSYTKNLGWRTHCLGCGRTKAKAVAPAAARQQYEPAENGDFVERLNAKQRKRAKSRQKWLENKKAEEEPKPVAEAADKPTPKAQRHPTATEEEIGEAPKVSVQAFGLTTMAALKDPRTAFEWPDASKTAYPKTAAQVVAEHKVCADTTKLSDAKEREATYAAMVAQCEGAEKVDVDWLEAANKLLKKAKTDITALAKATGGTAVEGMKAKLSNMTLQEAQRVEKDLVDKQNRTAKLDALKEQMRKQVEELNRRVQLFDAIRIESEAAWKADEEARANRFAEVVTAWESNIKEVVVNQASGEVEMAEEEAEEDEDDDEATREADYALVVPWSMDDLPTLEKPTPEEYTYWLHLATHVSEWAQKGCAPCTYADLVGPGVPEILMESLVKLIGAQYWGALYGTRFVNATDTVPRHLGFVLWNALMKPRELAEKELGKIAVEKAKTDAQNKVKTVLAAATAAKEKKKNKSTRKGGTIKKK